MSFTAEQPVAGLVIYQPRRGFRYGAEAFWLAGFALEGVGDVAGAVEAVLDLGTGSGVVAGLFAARGARAVGVDVRAEWRPLWRKSLEESAVPGSLELRLQDVRDLHGVEFPMVVSNPPFFPRNTGPVSPDPWKAAARTEGTATLAEFVATSARCLSSLGSACWV
ncbi:MAG: tRNA1Val (adenine37-N6)-methyltransferase, partial [Kiritimatiellia bacterium]